MKKIGLIFFALLLTFSLALTACSKSDGGEDAAINIGNDQETSYQDQDTGDTFLYVAYTTTTVEIVGYSGSDALHEVKIPGMIPGKIKEDGSKEPDKAVVRIGNEVFKDNNAITEVKLPYSVTEIGDFAFAGCDYLEKISFYDPDADVTDKGDDYIDSPQLKKIGISAFYCTKLTSVALPATLETIAEAAFWCCDKLETVTFGGTALTEIGNGAFYQCVKLTAIDIPEGTLTIGNQAFYKCTELADVTIPESVTTIGANVFTHTPYEDNK